MVTVKRKKKSPLGKKLAGQRGSAKERKVDLLPLLPAREVVPLPATVLPIQVSQKAHVAAVRFALEHEKYLVISYQKNGAKTSRKNLSAVVAICRIANSVEIPGGDLKIRVHVEGRGKIVSFNSLQPFIKVSVTELNTESVQLSKATERLMETMRSKLGVLAEYDSVIEDHLLALKETADPGAFSDLIAAVLPLNNDEALAVFLEEDALKRIKIVDGYLKNHLKELSIKEKISSQVQAEMSRSERELFLREQMRQIQVELGEEPDNEDDLRDLEAQLERVGMPPEIKKEVKVQLRRLKQLHPDTSEAALARTYLDWIADLPWSKRTKDRLDINFARKVLDEDHYGLQKTKERILDFLGVRKLKKESRGPILLFVGPPGVGKTSLGRSIASALGRKFFRLSLGGLRDEAELRGHRRTYIGAMPGRIIQGLKLAGSKNPVMMLDELDKVGADFRGDPAAVLLEILDPEQNRAFEDHYLNIPFDLSEVMFIGTANVTDTIPRALVDRVETIELSGYTNEEKLQIALRYLVPKQLEENGLSRGDLGFSEKSVEHIINSYTRESGVRELGRQIGTICRKCARMIAEEKKAPATITPKLVETLLGPIIYSPDRKLKSHEVGVCTGLAWTEVGGEILTVEVSKTKGKGQLSLTGQLGEVMRESAMAALTYVLSTAEHFGIDPNFYEQSNLHIHVPQGAIPKDGPSAGIAIGTALVSLLSNKAVSRDVAMTGEITLRGQVLQIGGLREKALAALRAGIRTVVIPKDNERELGEFPKYLLEKVHFVPVNNLDEVLQVALVGATKVRKAQSILRL